jgi:tRNA pseudouridine55 synthase
MKSLAIHSILPELPQPNVWEGVLVLDKPAGMSSNKVLQGLRKTANFQKMGYLGTLDPIATGVLPICIGWATKIIPFIVDYPKAYRAVMVLGKKTDTQDVSGQVVDIFSQTLPDRGKIEEVIRGFIGPQEQVPPSFSALKYKGKPLYHWARRGISISKPPRRITIDSIEILGIEGERVAFEIYCSPGTYIRTLCHDIGDRLECGAYLEELQRVQSGPFTLSQAHSLDEVGQAFSKEAIWALKIQTDTILQTLPQVRAEWGWREKIKQGGLLTAEPGMAPWPQVEPGRPICVKGPDGDLWAMYHQVEVSKPVYKPIRVII